VLLATWPRAVVAESTIAHLDFGSLSLRSLSAPLLLSAEYSEARSAYNADEPLTASYYLLATSIVSLSSLLSL
jgi:hypothetical protein